ncbi:universal stress protein [Shewanella sp. D64]|uniref:universal stress protein n=1 Tax=unclassified Shewanella TaxID=196818 RepID=UPI0022BA586A|nr:MULTISPECIES: universal stress protein [unclassified Shewanella]MEC4728627.1 universal stress protein [Shewanella sp. D64]MEC4737876.1 universal stress protein [Shewanella sp. E94]WBJ93871.1 universal stress protein [Shewanella sp. MTB7]
MSYKHILVSIALNKDSEKVLKRAAQIAKQNNAKLSLIHVDLDIPHNYEGMLGVDFQERESALRHESIASMNKLISTHDYEIKEHIFHSGYVDDEVIDSVEKYHIDLLIMGHHKSSFIRQMLLSPSEPVLRNMPCDLMFIKLDDDQA